MSPVRFVIPEKGMQDVAKSGKIPDRQIQSGNAWSCFVKKRFPDDVRFERGYEWNELQISYHQRIESL